MPKGTEAQVGFLEPQSKQTYLDVTDRQVQSPCNVGGPPVGVAGVGGIAPYLLSET